MTQVGGLRAHEARAPYLASTVNMAQTFRLGDSGGAMIGALSIGQPAIGSYPHKIKNRFATVDERGSAPADAAPGSERELVTSSRQTGHVLCLLNHLCYNIGVLHAKRRVCNMS